MTWHDREVVLDWGYFRGLYEGLHEHHDDVDGRRRYLAAHQRTAAEHLAELAPLRRQAAVGRVVHTEFFTAIGLTPFAHAGAFSPFHHEIFAVVEEPGATRVTVDAVLWPGFWFGDLLFCRAGVRVRAPRHLVDPVVATTSTLYFTSRRGPRPCNDLSHGWGSNSRWRTSFPRFYADADGFHLNWDGAADVGDGRLAEHRELLLHRCFVRGPLPLDEDDRHPYDDRLSLTASAWPLKPETITHDNT